MSKDFIDERIDACHEAIEEGNYIQVPNILKLIGEIRIHDKNIKAKIEMFEKEHDEKLEHDVVEIEKSSADSLRKQRETDKKYYLYAISYLKFYDRLRKEHEIY